MAEPARELMREELMSRFCVSSADPLDALDVRDVRVAETCSVERAVSVGEC